MLENFGLSFLPGADRQYRAPDDPTAQLEDVIKILSFRLPRQLSGSPIAPDALLNSEGSGGDPLADSIARRIIDDITRRRPQDGGPPMPSGGAPGSNPLDDIIRRTIPGGGFPGGGGGGQPSPFPGGGAGGAPGDPDTSYQPPPNPPQRTPKVIPGIAPPDDPEPMLPPGPRRTIPFAEPPGVDPSFPRRRRYDTPF